MEFLVKGMKRMGRFFALLVAMLLVVMSVDPLVLRATEFDLASLQELEALFSADDPFYGLSDEEIDTLIDVVIERIEFWAVQGLNDESVAVQLDVDEEAELIQDAGAHITGGFDGAVVVDAPGVVLADAVINGDLFITGAVGDGETFLDNVELSGTLIISTSGAEMVHITGDSVIPAVVIESADGEVNDVIILIGEGAAVDVVVVTSGILTVAGYDGYEPSIGTIVATGGASVVVSDEVSIGSLAALGDSVTVIVYGSIESLLVTGTDVLIAVNEDAVIEVLVIIGDDAIVINDGVIESLEITEEALVSLDWEGDNAETEAIIVLTDESEEEAEAAVPAPAPASVPAPAPAPVPAPAPAPPVADGGDGWGQQPDYVPAPPSEPGPGGDTGNGGDHPGVGQPGLPGQPEPCDCDEYNCYYPDCFYCGCCDENGNGNGDDNGAGDPCECGVDCEEVDCDCGYAGCDNETVNDGCSCVDSDYCDSDCPDCGCDDNGNGTVDDGCSCVDSDYCDSDCVDCGCDDDDNGDGSNGDGSNGNGPIVDASGIIDLDDLADFNENNDTEYNTGEADEPTEPIIEDEYKDEYAVSDEADDEAADEVIDEVINEEIDEAAESATEPATEPATESDDTGTEESTELLIEDDTTQESFEINEYKIENEIEEPTFGDDGDDE